ncbi:MAG: phosphate signaling complex protein PhoU [Xanthomonadaceae bacterium]|jgi:phosphate transport system protein|nr:phosphate signaling complex protein PhoU [Xanthomonadaceae bacterium]
MNTSEHISKQYDADLAALRSRVVEMGGVVEEQFRFAVDALSSGRSDLAEQVVANDRRVNELEVEIDDDCAHVIAKRQPAASDLRMVLGVSKMTTDLERIGDKARKIARLSAAVRSSGEADARWLEDTHRTADAARGLLRDALNAFVRGELEGAIAVIRAAQGVGQQVSAISRSLVKRMGENPGQVAVLLDMMAINKAVDRVADHAGNLAEHLIYIIKGTDVRHATLDQIERETLQR